MYDKDTPVFRKILISLEISPRRSHPSLKELEELIYDIGYDACCDYSFSHMETAGLKSNIFVWADLEYCRSKYDFRTIAPFHITKIYYEIESVWGDNFYGKSFRLGDKSYRISSESIKIQCIDLDTCISFDGNRVKGIQLYGINTALYTMLYSARHSLYMHNLEFKNSEKPIFDIILNGNNMPSYPVRLDPYSINSIITKTSIRFYVGFIYDIESDTHVIKSKMCDTILSIVPSFVRDGLYYEYYDLINIQYLEVVLSKIKNKENINSLSDDEFSELLKCIIDSNKAMLMYLDLFLDTPVDRILEMISSIVHTINIDENIVVRTLYMIRNNFKNYNIFTPHITFIQSMNKVANYTMGRLIKELTRIDKDDSY